MKNEKMVHQEIGLKEKWIEYFLMNRSKIYSYFGGFILAVSVMIAYSTTHYDAKAQSDVQKMFDEWSKKPSDEQLFNQLSKSLAKTAEIRKFMEPEIVQILIGSGQSEKINLQDLSCIQLLQKILPNYAKFANNTLLIEKKSYQKALEESVFLKELIEREQDGKKTALYASNLLRIAFLQKELKNGAGEIAAWEDVKAILNIDHGLASEFMKDSFNLMSSKQFDLTQYIQARELCQN